MRVVCATNRRKDGTDFPVEAHVSVVSFMGAERMVTASVRDVSEQMHASQLLKTKAEQQQVVSTLSLRALHQDTLSRAGLDTLYRKASMMLADSLKTTSNTILELEPGPGRYVLRGCHCWPETVQSQAVVIQEGTGSLLGFTLLTKAPVLVADYRTETRFEVPPLLKESGAVSGMSVIIHGEDDSVYGTVSVHDRRQREFTSDDVAFVQAIANILSAAITRQRSRASLQNALDEAAAARREAERANRAKSDFLSRMSHELRTPLNAILGFGQLLQMEEGATEMNKDCADHVVSAGRHLLSLVDDVLDIARIESGNDVPRLTSVPVAGLLEQTVQLVRPDAAERGVRLELLATYPAHAALLADERRLRQVLLNLLSNAIKYNSPGGQVTVECRAARAGTLRLRVQDTGPGLTPEQIARLWSPFERLGAEQRGIQGTGLGLAVSRRLAEAMGGVIGLDSVPGEGSIFWVDLPAVEEAHEDAPEARTADQEPGARMLAGAAAPEEVTSILQIEDNPSNQRVLQMLVTHQRRGWRLLSAPNARTGMEIARSQLPALIVLDLHLPDLNGEEVLAMLREDRTTKHIPVVMLSADATSRSREQLLEAGAAAYVSKPFDMSNLLEVLDQALDARAPEFTALEPDRRPRRTVRVGRPDRFAIASKDRRDA